MRFKYLIITVFCLGFLLKAHGQQTFVVKGVVSRNISVERIAQVLITNMRSHDIVMSDQLGWFSVKAAVGDTVVFSKLNFTDQRIVIGTETEIPVYMQPVIQLDQVTIKGQTKKQELADVMADYRRQGTFYNGKPPILSFLTNPLTGIYELFGSTPGRARRFAQFSKGEVEYAELRRRYNRPMVMRALSVDSNIAKHFMEYYTPSSEDLKEWNDYELISHIRKSYDFYENSDNKEKLEQLNQPTFIKPKEQQPD